jgi:pimeloyl-ACP methyl ester carboxylesterase
VGDLHADGNAVRAILDEGEEPAALVEHSYGGMVITDAVCALPRRLNPLCWCPSLLAAWLVAT